MKFNFRISALILAFMMVIPLMASCTKSGNTDESTGKTESQSETLEETLLPEPQNDLKIVENGKSEFKIVRPEICTDAEKKALTDIGDFFKTEYGVSIKTGDDWVNADLGYPENKFEILIGLTNREESKAVYNNIRTNDFAVTIVDTKIVIAAYTEENLQKATEYFKEKVKISKDEATLKASDAKIENAEYKIKDINVQGIKLSNYSIITKAGTYASINNGAQRLQKEIEEIYSYRLPVKTDALKESEYEIVIGGTNRGESEKISHELQSFDYEISVKDKKIYINTGINERTPDAAVSAFILKLSELEKDGEININPENMDIKYHGEYKASDIKINGNSIMDYALVYSAGNIENVHLVSKIRFEIERLCGRRINVVIESTKYDGKMIFVGANKKTEKNEFINSKIKSIADDEFYIFAKDDYVFIGGNGKSQISIVSAVNRFTDLIKNSKADKDIVIDLGKTEKYKAKLTEYKVISYNDGDNSYGRVDEIVAILQDYDPDLIGLQETRFSDSLKYDKKLKGYKKIYYAVDKIGYDKYGTPIYYKEDKFELLDSGTQFLSDTPDKEFSKYEDSDYTRSYVYAVFKDRSSGEIFVMVNTHIDYNDEANTRQVAKLLELTKAKFEGMPIFYTADWNMSCKEPGYKKMQGAGYINAYNYGKDSVIDMDKPIGINTIDFCFVDCASFVAKNHKIIRDHKYSDSASDHYAVYCEVILCK